MAETPRSVPLQVIPQMEVTELRDGRYPGKVMRALLGVREVMLIVALALASILMVLLLAGLGAIMNNISQVTTPDPTISECFEGETC